MRKTVKNEWNIDDISKGLFNGSFFAFYSRKIVVSCNWIKNRKFLWYNSVDAFALAGTVFCRSNRKERNSLMACVDYRQSTENLKSYIQRQWSLMGGMAGTFREME